MTSRILLVRHGRSAHRHDGRWMRAQSLQHFENAYDAAGILDGDVPPRELMGAAANAQIVAASDLPRAIASAQRLAPGRELAVSPLLREIRLEPPRWVPFPLPIEAWDAHSHVQWSYRLMRGSDHAHMRRANAAAAWLIERAEHSPTIMAVTHGGFRRLLAKHLIMRGWRDGFERRSYDHWSVWSYSRE